MRCLTVVLDRSDFVFWQWQLGFGIAAGRCSFELVLMMTGCDDDGGDDDGAVLATANFRIPKKNAENSEKNARVQKSENSEKT